jgi:NTE family protein
MAWDHTAFVLGGGGQMGAHEVGMLRALLERGIRPDLVVGTSIGAINGASVAADPSPAAVDRLTRTWSGIERDDVFGGSIFGRLGTLARTRTHLHDNASLRARLAESLPARIEDLAVPFQCVAASIEQAAEHWFERGPLVDAVLASSAVPGILPPVEIGGEPPRWPWEVALVAFEIARRHRFVGDLAALPPGIDVHVMPTGQPDPPRYSDLSQYRYRDTSRIGERIERAHAASLDYLAERDLGVAA